MEKVDNTEQFLTQLLCCVTDQWGEKRRIIESAVHIFQPAISQSWAHTHTYCFVAGSCQIVLHFAILGTLYQPPGTLYQSQTVLYRSRHLVLRNNLVLGTQFMSSTCFSVSSTRPRWCWPCCPVFQLSFSILSLNWFYSCVVTVISEQNSPKAYYKQTFLAVKGRSESFRKFIHFLRAQAFLKLPWVGCGTLAILPCIHPILYLPVKLSWLMFTLTDIAVKTSGPEILQ